MESSETYKKLVLAIIAAEEAALNAKAYTIQFRLEEIEGDIVDMQMLAIKAERNNKN